MTQNVLKNKISLDPTIVAAKTQYPTPVSDEIRLDPKEKVNFIADRFREIMWALGLDLTDDSLTDTPKRVAEMYVNEIFKGLDIANFPKVTFFQDKIQLDNMVLVKTHFMSMCEHHFLPMFGTAHVAYVPNGKLIGLSKIPRIVDYFARRPQLQERLTAQVADALTTLLNTEDVAVSTTAEHFCVKARGVEDPHGEAVMHSLHGRFKSDPQLRDEFLSSI